jgi:serine protease
VDTRLHSCLMQQTAPRTNNPPLRIAAVLLLGTCLLAIPGGGSHAIAQVPNVELPDAWPVVSVRVAEQADFETLLDVPAGGGLEAQLLDGAVLVPTTAGIPDASIERILRRTREVTGRDVLDPRMEGQIRLQAGVDLDAAIALLRARPGVLEASRAPRPVSPPDNPPNYQPYQSYQNSGGGVGAERAWSELGLSGAGVAVCDVEYDFNEDHCDLPEIQVLGFEPVSPYGDNHGTAVLGEMVSLDNDWGTKGTGHGSTDVFFSPTYDGSIYSVSAAIYRAIDALPEGAILVLEVHMPGPNSPGGSQDGYVPNEWRLSDYNATVAAVANGLVVVAAAGNGGEDLDDPIYSTGNGGHWPFLPENDSGAILVGAGGAPASCYGNTFRARLGFSNYGQRVNVQAHGECVRTTGYSDIFDEESCDYTAYFSGTSSATPIVAGACMLIQEYAQATFGRPLTSWEMREALMASGDPQSGNDSEHIGPLPDVLDAIATLDIAPPCIADIDGDGLVDGVDLSRLLGFWGQPGEADVDRSGTTDGTDLSIVLGSWGACAE